MRSSLKGSRMLVTWSEAKNVASMFASYKAPLPKPVAAVLKWDTATMIAGTQEAVAILCRGVAMLPRAGANTHTTATELLQLRHQFRFLLHPQQLVPFQSRNSAL
mmetsp:Transcript_89125/g.260534  ORF Transcript_89125/g.260534 Transcript_89125/m.260534 type:complete len:105 (-) Transcript_89125:687-1001(-)